MALYAVLAFQTVVHFLPGVSQRVDVAAHVGGAVTGMIWAYLLQAQAAQRVGGSKGSSNEEKELTGLELHEKRQLDAKTAEAAKNNSKATLIRP